MSDDMSVYPVLFKKRLFQPRLTENILSHGVLERVLYPFIPLISSGLVYHVHSCIYIGSAEYYLKEY